MYSNESFCRKLGKWIFERFPCGGTILYYNVLTVLVLMMYQSVASTYCVQLVQNKERTCQLEWTCQLRQKIDLSMGGGAGSRILNTLWLAKFCIIILVCSTILRLILYRNQCHLGVTNVAQTAISHVKNKYFWYFISNSSNQRKGADTVAA